MNDATPDAVRAAIAKVSLGELDQTPIPDMSDDALTWALLHDSAYEALTRYVATGQLPITTSRTVALLTEVRRRLAQIGALRPELEKRD